jgi:hypothetical protein
MEGIELPLNSSPDFGRRSTITITRNGDLITHIYLMVRLNRVVVSCGSRFAWVRRLGYALLCSVEVEIGGSKIDKQYGTWLNIWYELARAPGKQERGFAEMIGDVHQLTAYNDHDKEEYILYIPLKFWFNRHVGLALPLIALQYHEVRLNFEFTRAEELIIANNHFRQFDLRCICMKDVQLLVDYIYLDSEERRRFAQVGHEYLIEQLQFTGTDSIQCQTGKFKLDFNHPTKEIVWAIKNGNFICGKQFVFYTNKHWHRRMHEAAEKILRESMVLLCAETSLSGSSGDDCSIVPNDGEIIPTCGDWEEFCPGFGGITCNGKIMVENNSCERALWVNTSSLRICGYNITDKIWADVFVTKENRIRIAQLRTTLTVRDISFPVDEMEDTRAWRDDVHIHQFMNFGVLLNGRGNPVACAQIFLNGQERFDKREGNYFNYVQPYQHHTNTPADGINVYSFALHPESHQPSGSANLSRIDNTQLHLWFWDPTFRPCLPPLHVVGCNNRLFIYGFNYNILRVMSGMGGLAYAN